MDLSCANVKVIEHGSTASNSNRCGGQNHIDSNSDLIHLDRDRDISDQTSNKISPDFESSKSEPLIVINQENLRKYSEQRKTNANGNQFIENGKNNQNYVKKDKF